jgi:proline dehydrogenase
MTSLWQPLLRKAAESYIVGTEVGDAIAKATELDGHGAASTICFWDAVDDSPRHVADQYLLIIHALRESKIDSYLSIKVPSLRYDMALVNELLAEASPAGMKVHFDSLAPETADPTFNLIACVHSRYPNLSCTLPGAWRRSIADAELAIQLGLHVRVVKGQWPDPDGPAADPRDGFLRIVDALAGRARKVAVASHDPLLAAAAIGKLQQAGTKCELELLFGLPSRAVLQVAQRLGVKVRYYLPYGYAWLPYALNQAKRNPRILWWVVRDAFAPRLA